MEHAQREIKNYRIYLLKKSFAKMTKKKRVERYNTCLGQLLVVYGSCRVVRGSMEQFRAL